MSKKITYSWGEDNLLINLGSRVLPRIRILFWAEFIFTTGWATIFFMRSFPLSESLINSLSCLGASILYLIASYRFISRMFRKEKLMLRHDRLVIVERTPFRQKARSFEWRFMGPLHYVGIDKKTDHPLKGQCYDYFGFETQEHLIQNLHNEGNLYFNYGGFSVRFGKGVYSWDAEEVVNMMKLFMGTRLILGPEWDRMIQHYEVDDLRDQ